MYNLLSLVIGAVVAIMIAINGQLTSAYDLFVSAAIIHVIGTVFSLIVCLCRHQKILVKAEASVDVFGWCNWCIYNLWQ